MKKLFYLALLATLFGCGNLSKGKVENEQVGGDTIVAVEAARVWLLSDDFEVVSVKTGWGAFGQNPKVSIKLRNIAGYAISKSIDGKYQFIVEDEILCEGTCPIHSRNFDWEDGMSKTIEISSYSDCPREARHKVRAKVCFEDGSPIWEGYIEQGGSKEDDENYQQGSKEDDENYRKLVQAVDMGNRMLPQKALGTTLEKMTIEEDRAVYNYTVDERLCNMDNLINNQTTRKGTLIEMLKATDDANFRKFVELCVKNNKKLSYRYKGDTSGKTMEIVLSVSELRSFLNDD